MRANFGLRHTGKLDLPLLRRVSLELTDYFHYASFFFHSVPVSTSAGMVAANGMLMSSEEFAVPTKDYVLQLRVRDSAESIMVSCWIQTHLSKVLASKVLSCSVPTPNRYPRCRCAEAVVRVSSNL